MNAAPRHFTTERLVVRPPCGQDAPSIERAAGDRAIADTMISVPHPYPKGEGVRYLQRRKQEFDRGEALVYILESRNEGTFQGLIEIRQIDPQHRQGELSFWLARDAWGRRLIGEALPLVLEEAFRLLPLNRLYACHMVRNGRTGSILARFGFVKEGVMRQRVWKWDRYEDVVLAALLLQDWQRWKQEHDDVLEESG